MIYKFGILLLASYVCRSSALPPCVCTRIYQPVCGSNGETYGNKCLLDCAQFSHHDLALARPGSCDEQAPASCICTFEYKPVCGSDGTTYPNQCSLNCARARNGALEQRNDGPCKSEELRDLPCTCTREMKPVCGSDGVTYSNLCLFKCNEQKKPDLTVKHTGPCESEVMVVEQPLPASCSCTRNLQPVCGTDGITYNNPCLLNCAAQNKPLALKADGPCEGSETVRVAELKTDPPRSCVCTRNYMPVCGSDGRTYPNSCMLGCAGESNPDLKLSRVGPCDGGLSVDVVEHPVY